MSNLTGQQINLTYPGLLNLANATTGITQNLQAIQDGLGNNTGMRIATNQLEAPNLVSIIPLPNRYYGSGILGDSNQPFTAGVQGEILAYPFYDQGRYEYSAMTVFLNTATTVSDTIEAAFYTTQMINPNGIFPSSVVLSGISITTTGSTGYKVINFPSNLSFSGYGGGIYWFVFKFTSASNPNVRFRSSLTLTSSIYSPIYGYAAVFGTPPNPNYNNIWRPNTSAGGPYAYFSGQTNFENPFPTNLDTLQITVANYQGNAPGFLLHTVGY